jgi:hypothetical protein
MLRRFGSIERADQVGTMWSCISYETYVLEKKPQS